MATFYEDVQAFLIVEFAGRLKFGLYTEQWREIEVLRDELKIALCIGIA